MIFPPVVGPDVESRQCIGQSSNAQKISLNPYRSSDDLERDMYLLPFHSRVRPKLCQELRNFYLISRNPIIRRPIFSHRSKTKHFGQKDKIFLLLLCDLKFNAHSESKLFLTVRFNDRHNGTISVNESGNICQIDYSVLLSYGVSSHASSLQNLGPPKQRSLCMSQPSPY
jgi:hypothetical protein